MIHQLIEDCLAAFDVDCRLLCEHHYPTVHNRGMKENHLGKALARRLCHQLMKLDINAETQEKRSDPAFAHPVYMVSYEGHEIWIVAQQMLSANHHCRETLIEELNLIELQMEHVNQQHILIIADHWFDRSRASKQLPAWWIGELPNNLQAYYNEGIRLQASPDSLRSNLKHRFGWREINTDLRHPLLKVNTDLPIHRYMLLSAHIDLSRC
ncbi:hypothetical protein [Thaumasiovibrio subtropicus]|uniref:hypothetical protein n=1 Tax=Thaumasiovibrio subtropicus TaxID=1891207 RepID=UPI00131ECD19|nr:hypothetical protein [Thaumasiovibrio subtropicus]